VQKHKLVRPDSFIVLDSEEQARRLASSSLSTSIRAQQYKYLWTRAANCILAALLFCDPEVFFYKQAPLAANDQMVAIAVFACEVISFRPALSTLRWLTPVIATWLMLAPLVYKTSQPEIGVTDTLIAVLFVTFSTVVPGVPASRGLTSEGPDVPPGWTYNPSSWIRRWLGIALALAGFLISRYLAARQLGWQAHAWDPFFLNGTDLVLHSHLSQQLPVSDAGLGAIAYMFEVLLGFMGGRARWRTAPCAVLAYLLLVLPLGATSILLVISQPIIVKSWCSLCLFAATCLLISVPLAVHELIATFQLLLSAKRAGCNVWHVFWYGATISGAGQQDPDRMNWSIYQRYIASVQGVTVPVSLILQVGIGVALLALPSLVDSFGSTASIERIIGAVIITAAAIASAEVTRTVRFINSLAAVALFAVGLFAVAKGNGLAGAIEMICAIIVIIASLNKGAILERYGAWDEFIK
jgi:hypothetical protein